MFGTGEPKLFKFKDDLISWSDSIRKEIDADRIHDDLVSLPAPRNRIFSPDAMLQAEQMILDRFTDAGWSAEQQPFTFDNVEGIVDTSPRLVLRPTIYERLEGANIIATRKGIEEPQKAIVVLGHYDTVRNSPGANDNTASVAALLELARVLEPWKFRNSVILAMPDMEELYFIGAKALVKTLVESYKLIGAINFETMGYTATEPETQSVPPGLGSLYGGQIKRVKENEFRGDFTCIIYNGKATALAGMTAAALNHQVGNQSTILFRDPNDLPFIGRILNKLVPTVRNFSRSDHVLFWNQGIAALQLTDTANFRYQHYHQPTDTPEKVDYIRIADIVAATATVVAKTAGLIQ